MAGRDDPEQVPVITAQPSVSKRHITAAARLCPDLDGMAVETSATRVSYGQERVYALSVVPGP
ncbi:hypothetical protein ACH4ZX_33680 [Streptomyces sp. NPDC020490]|uniref:hypothetical protein n=1 Tax=Streptomyces sp. NPDC020490 TaxID=3365078 RepID=UPI00379D6F94